MIKFSLEEKQYFIDVCNESNSMAQACAKLGLHFNTFKKIALEFNCYKPNQSGKECNKNRPKVIKTEDILNGDYPEFQTYKLKKRLIDEHYIEDKCYVCGWNMKRFNERYSPCELHHKDGDKTNHKLSNLILLCPNCHSLTLNHRAKNIKKQSIQMETFDMNVR